MFVLSLSLLSFTGLGTKNWVFKVQNPWQSAGYHSETEVNKVWMDKKKTVYQMRVVTVFSLKKHWCLCCFYCDFFRFQYFPEIVHNDWAWCEFSLTSHRDLFSPIARSKYEKPTSKTNGIKMVWIEQSIMPRKHKR